MTASVSVTAGFSAAEGADADSPGAGAAVVAAGRVAFADCAAVGTGMAFCRVAR